MSLVNHSFDDGPLVRSSAAALRLRPLPAHVYRYWLCRLLSALPLHVCVRVLTIVLAVASSVRFGVYTPAYTLCIIYTPTRNGYIDAVLAGVVARAVSSLHTITNELPQVTRHAAAIMVFYCCQSRLLQYGAPY